MELTLLIENIRRIKDYKVNNKHSGNYNSLVVGEFKHRCIALKQRLTLASRITTYDILKK